MKEPPPLFQQNNTSPSFSACKLLNGTGFLTSCSLNCTTPDTSRVQGLGNSIFFFFFNVNHDLVGKLRPKFLALVLLSLKYEFELIKIYL